MNLMNNNTIIDYICIVAIRDSKIQMDILARPHRIYLVFLLWLRGYLCVMWNILSGDAVMHIFIFQWFLITELYIQEAFMINEVLYKNNYSRYERTHLTVLRFLCHWVYMDEVLQFIFHVMHWLNYLVEFVII